MKLFLVEIPAYVEDTAKWVAAIGGISGAIVFIAKKIVKPAVQNVRKLASLIETIESTCAQLQPNHGTSLRDVIHRIEARLLLIEGRDNALLSDHALGIFHCDRDGRNLYVNRTYCKMLGASRGDISGYGWRNFISEEDRDEYDKRWKEAFKQEREFEAPVTFTRSDGEAFRAVVRTYLMQQPGSNEVLGYFGLVRPEATTSFCVSNNPCPSKLKLDKDERDEETTDFWSD